MIKKIKLNMIPMKAHHLALWYKQSQKMKTNNIII